MLVYQFFTPTEDGNTITGVAVGETFEEAKAIAKQFVNEQTEFVEIKSAGAIVINITQPFPKCQNHLP